MFKDWVSDENLAQMERWTRHGLSNEQIAKNIGICEQTFYNWKEKHVEFLEGRIVKLSATILNDIPQMVFCNQDTFVDVC